MTQPSVHRASCRFKVVAGEKNKPAIRMELFHETVAALKDTVLEFELLGGISEQQAKSLVETMNDRIVGIMVHSVEKEEQSSSR